MARHQMRDHRQAPAWPKRPVSSGRAMWRQFEDDLDHSIRAERQFRLTIDEVGDRIMAVLRDLDDDELARMDPTDPRINVVLSSPHRRLFGNWITQDVEFVGETMIAHEQERRAALTGHERIAELRERMRRKEVEQ